MKFKSGGDCTSHQTQNMENQQIINCSQEDFFQILSEIEYLWGSNRTLVYHHPMFIYEFGNTAFVIKEQDKVIAYLFGFISQKEQIGYVHLIGVRQNFQKKGLGRRLYEHFIEILKEMDIFELKAITTPANEKSIKFHLQLGMKMMGVENEDGVKVIKNYSGPGQDRVVFKMQIKINDN